MRNLLLGGRELHDAQVYLLLAGGVGDGRQFVHDRLERLLATGTVTLATIASTTSSAVEANSLFLGLLVKYLRWNT